MGLADELMRGVRCNPGGEDFVSTMRQVATDMEQSQAEWIAQLRAEGVKAAHPDDGWIDREKNTVTFCYPQFNDGAGAGELVALGWYDRHRLVRLVRPVRQWFGGSPTWEFEAL